MPRSTYLINDWPVAFTGPTARSHRAIYARHLAVASDGVHAVAFCAGVQPGLESLMVLAFNGQEWGVMKIILAKAIMANAACPDDATAAVEAMVRQFQEDMDVSRPITTYTAPPRAKAWQWAGKSW